METKLLKTLIPTKRGFHFEETDNIIYFQSLGNNCTIKMKDGREIISTKSLKCYAESLSNGSFIRIHKSYLVNLNHIIEFNCKDDFQVKLDNDCCIKVAARRRGIVRKTFINGFK